MTQIIYLDLIITINYNSTPDPNIQHTFQTTLQPFQALTEGCNVRIDVAEDLAYEVVGNYLSRELRADIDTALIGCLGSMEMVCPPVMDHIDVGEF